MVITRAEKILLLKEQEAALNAAREQYSSRLLTVECPEAAIPQYTLLKLIGKGGFSSVYKATNEKGDVVAVKVQTKERLRSTRSAISMAINEKTYLLGCDSIFIVKCYGTWRSANYLALVMEFAPYGDLFNRLKMHGPLTERRALYYVAQIVCALEYMHASNLIYGDTKPGNCLIFAKGRLKLGDFGHTRYGLNNLVGSGGSLPFLAPEALFETNYSELVDWWALGVTIHMLLLKSYPYCEVGERRSDIIARLEAPDPLSFPELEASTLSADAKDLIRCLLVKDLTKRLGRGPGGAENVRKHRWFGEVDFLWVRSTDFICPNFDFSEIEGEDCAADFLKLDDDEDEDLNAFEFQDY